MTTNKGANRTFLITIIVYVLFSFLWGFVGEAIGSSFYADIAISQLLVFLPSFCYIKIAGMKVGELIPYRKINIKDGILAILMTYLFYPALMVMNMISMFFVKNTTAEMTGRMEEESFLLNLLFVAILPACVEEFVFRGMLYHTYRQYSMIKGVFLSAFLFGCMHMNFNQFLYTFVFGVFLALTIEATGSIFTSMMCHFILNMNSVVLVKILELAGNSSAGSALEQSSSVLEAPKMLVAGTISWAVIAVFTTAGAMGIWVHLAKKNGRLEKIRNAWGAEAKGKCITPSLILGVIISVVLMIFLEVLD